MCNNIWRLLGYANLLADKKTRTECVHQLVVALLPVGSSVAYRVAVGGCVAEGTRRLALFITAAAVLAPGRAGRVRGAAAASAAHLLDHVYLSTQLCQQRRTRLISIHFKRHLKKHHI